MPTLEAVPSLSLCLFQLFWRKRISFGRDLNHLPSVLYYLKSFSNNSLFQTLLLDFLLASITSYLSSSLGKDAIFESQQIIKNWHLHNLPIGHFDPVLSFFKFMEFFGPEVLGELCQGDLGSNPCLKKLFGEKKVTSLQSQAQ